MSSRTVVQVTDSTNRFINELPHIIERAAAKDEDFRKLINSVTPQVDKGAKTDVVVKSLANSIVAEIEQTEMIRIDLAAFNGKLIQIPVSDDTTISDVLDFLYFEISKSYPLEPGTYGKFWILDDAATNKPFKGMGLAWAESQKRSHDNRKLHEKGIRPGMLLKARVL
jgi:hypothetical protein